MEKGAVGSGRARVALAVEPLNDDHGLDDFDCGCSVCGDYLRRQASSDQWLKRSRTYVASCEGRVIGYFTICPGVVELEASREQIELRRRRRLTPVVVLSRLAVDARAVGGVRRRRAVLVDALGRCAAAARALGARAVVALGLHEESRRDLLRLGFLPLPGSAVHLFLPLDLPPEGRPLGLTCVALLYNQCAQSARNSEPRVWVSWGRHGFDGAHV